VAVLATARLDYGLRALIALAAADRPLKGDELATEHNLPIKFLENVLGDLRRGGLVHSKRGGSGGYWLARPPRDITVADVIRVITGQPDGSTHLSPLASMWASLDAAVMRTAEGITLLDLQDPSGDLR
jgi:Rrf2 family protein